MVTGELPAPLTGMELPLERNSTRPRIVTREAWLEQLRNRHAEAGI